MSTMRAAVLANYGAVVRELGLNPAAQLRAVGLSEAMLESPDRPIPSEAVLRLLENAAVQGRCEVVGLRMSEARGMSHFGVVSLLLSQQRCMRDALQMSFRYLPLINASLALWLDEDGDIAVLREEILAAGASPSRQAIELAMATNVRLFRLIVGEDWRPRRVHFRHAAPKSLELHQRVFRCPCEFGASFDALSFARKDLDAPNPAADPRMAQYALGFIGTLADAEARPVTAEVRRAVYLLLPLGQATLVQVAASIGCSARKLQLDLASAGTSFEALLDEARRERVQLYLDNARFDLGQVASLLGYRHQSSFTRWFIGGFGVTPTAWRARSAARPASSAQQRRSAGDASAKVR